MGITDEQKVAFSYAIADINRGCINTLWVNRLKNEYPELYRYAIEQIKDTYPKEYETAINRGF
jgi:hypothetical protein